MASPDHSTAIGRLEGEVKHIAQDLATCRQRMHEIGQAVQGVSVRLQTLYETATPQRERMIADLDEIKTLLATMPDLVNTVDGHGKMLKDHEAFKNKSLGAIGVVGGVAGFVGALIVKAISVVGWIK